MQLHAEGKICAPFRIAILALFRIFLEIPEGVQFTQVSK